METINKFKEMSNVLINKMFDLKLHTNNDFILIEVPQKDIYVSYKYEIYGNNKFFSSGILEVIGDQNPYITFNLETLEDTIFFIKVSAKLDSLTETETYFSFYNHEETKIKKNLIMEISESNNNITDQILEIKPLPIITSYSVSTEGSDVNSNKSVSDVEDEDENNSRSEDESEN